MARFTRRLGKLGERWSERWSDISLRAKITGVTVFILFLGLIVAGVGTLSVLHPMLSANQANRLIQLRTDPTNALARGANTNALERGDVLYANQRYYVALLDPEGNLQYDNTLGRDATVPKMGGLSLDKVLTLSDAVIQLHSEDGVEWQAVVAPILADGQPQGTLVIAESTAGIKQLITNYVTVFTGFGIAVILLGAALTRLLITTTLLPLAEVEKTALEIARGDFSKRIMISSPHTEVGHLGESLNVMLDRLDGSLADRAYTIDRMRRFIGDASHELRTPLVSVRGYAELYRMGALQDDEQVAQAMERIEKEAIRMTSLVEDLLALARIDERRGLELVSLDLNSLAQDAALDARAQAPGRVVSVVEDAAAPAVLGDEHKVRQLMTNLIGNAMRHTAEDTPIELVVSTPALPAVEEPAAAGASGAAASGAAKPVAPLTGAIARITSAIPIAGGASARSADAPGGADTASDTFTDSPVAITDDGGSPEAPTGSMPVPASDSASGTVPNATPDPTTTSGQMVRFEIVDHGDGVPAQIREKIFDRFWRADNSRNRETGGSGLGLAIVKSIVDAHHGTVTVHETPGGGATFRVDLPATP